MKVVAQPLQINISRIAGIEGLRAELQLEAEGQVIFPVGIFQIGDWAVRRLAGSIKKHHGCRGLSVDLPNQMSPFCHPVPVKVENYLDGGIFFQDALNAFQRICICLAPVKRSLPQIIDRGIVDHLIALLSEKFCQILPHPHNRRLTVSPVVICKLLLGVAVVNENLRLGAVLLQGKIL